MAVYQADLNEMNNDKPKWFYSYSKNKKQFALKLKSFTFGPPLKMRELQSSLSIDNCIKFYWHIKDEPFQQKILSFVMIRNIIKLQIFLRAILKMRHDAAFKIQRKRRMLKIINL